jgi:hypothetical protein
MLFGLLPMVLSRMRHLASTVLIGRLATLA